MARRLTAVFLIVAGILSTLAACALGREGARRAALAPVSEKLVALTFDDGPRRLTTTALLDGLSQRGVKATFFLVGQQLEGNEDIILRMDREGHQIGLHSYNHKVLTGLNSADFYQEVDCQRRELTALLGHNSFLLRPPYGMVDGHVQRMAGAPIILWSVDPEDWKDDNCDRQTAIILDQVEDGSIILLHDIYPSSVETALRVVDALLGQGYYFVTIEQLFAAKGVALEKGEVYRNG